MINLCRSNNEAANLVASGNLRRAYRILQDATKTACRALSVLDTDDDSEMAGNATIEEQVLVTAVKISGLKYEESNVFLHAFAIQEDRINEWDVHAKLPSICAILICNMAICCHGFFYTTQDCRKRQQALAQARQLYSEAADVLQHLDLSGCLGQVFLGICNNMVEVAYEDGNLDNVQHWYSLLSDAFSGSKTSTYDPALCRSAFRSVVYYSGNMVSARAA